MEEESDRYFFKINGIAVDSTIFTQRYDCDASYYGCTPQCCSRGCLLLPEEILRVQKFLPEIIPYLSPQKQEYLKHFPFHTVRHCSVCQAEKIEKENLRIHCPDISQLICTAVVEGGCIFSFNDGGIHHCALHSYALSRRWKLNAIKPLDCIQFPIALRKHQGQLYLYFQKVKAFDNLPCLLHPKPGPLMYQTLQYPIEILLGEDFYRRLKEESANFIVKEKKKCQAIYLPN